jgi:GT2 family glycosyltransferase
MSDARIDVVIVSFNTRDDLLACLDSIRAARCALVDRVTVVDNQSADGSVEAVRSRHPEVDLIAQDRNAGFGAANNVGIRRGNSPLVLLLNSDTIVPPGAIETLAARLEATGATAAGPRLIDADDRPEVSFGPMLSPASEFVQMLWVRIAAGRSSFFEGLAAQHLAKEREVDWVTGACLLVRRDAAEAAGLFDERYFLYEEDVDFCAALRARGGRVLFTPATTVVHRRGRSPKPTTGPSHYDRSHLAFYEKHAPHWAPLLRAWLRLRGRAIR